MNVCVTGGAGYVGSQLIPHLINHGHKVTVLDTFWYMDQPFAPSIAMHPNYRAVKGDIRDQEDLMSAFEGQDAVIHLACVSNDPSFEMNPGLGKSINLDSFPGILEAAKKCKVGRFIYASSSSVYGVKDKVNVTELDTCEPLTDYSKFKLDCETILQSTDMGSMEWSIIRPATVCGHAKRMRFDLSVNILTLHALVKGKITVHGGGQLRPNLNINDMVRAYDLFLNAPGSMIHKEIFNIGFENKTILAIAEEVKDAVKFLNVKIEIENTVDNRSYHINSGKALAKLGFEPIYNIRNAIDSIALAHSYGLYSLPLENPDYCNIKKMKKLEPI